MSREGAAGPVVNTVLGPCPPGELGVTLAHEHLWTRNESVYVQFPHLHDEALAADRIVGHLTQAREKGLRSMCDEGVAGLGRDIRFMQEISRQAGVRILAGTGFYTFDELPPYFAGRDIDTMADAFVHDLEVGIQGSEVRAAFLKCATDAPGLTPGVEKVLRACARAHRRTGAPIVTHTTAARRNGLDQLDVFDDEGVDAANVMIGHCGDTDDLEYLGRVLDRDALLGMDRFGMGDFLSMERRLATVVALWERGFGDRMLLSQDHSIVRDKVHTDEVYSQRGEWLTTTIFDRVIPSLIEAGIPVAEVDAMVTVNPQRWLTWCDPY
jgi:phosphotriesterase-related protein